MANESKPSRTQVEDLDVSETELTTEEARKVQGGTGATAGKAKDPRLDKDKLAESSSLSAGYDLKKNTKA